MLGIINFNSFLIAAIILSLMPGSDTMFVLGNSISIGKKAGLMSAIGTTIGCVVHTSLAALGLSVILTKSIFVFNIIKYLGAGYLIYLGIRSLISKSSISLQKGSGEKNKLKKLFIQGVLTDVLNPKVALFFLAFLPQFINPNNTHGILPFFLLGIIFTLIGLVWLFILTMVSSYISEQVSKKIGLTDILNKITGIIFVGLGLNLLRAKLER
jgi:Putative threonine efflux protein